jgi:hypothetical protein
LKTQNNLWWLVPTLLMAACGDGTTSTPIDTDSGTPKDAGEITDLGTDSGTPPKDTGTPPKDSGSPAEDTGSPAEDTGSPAEDTGSPAEDTGSPAEDTGSPPEDTGSPTDTGTPPVDAGTPADVPTCPAGQAYCGTSCVDINVDNTNCGACGVACATGQSCQTGVCRINCAMGQTLCGGACATLDSDPANCGACANACPTGQMCSAGACALTCAAPRVVCSATGGVMSCIDTLTDANNCGTCGNACAMGQSCVAGVCRLVCPAGQTACGGACVDTNTSSANCGGCGTACATGQSCAVGMCRRDCAAGETRCGDACVNTQTSAANCGTCGTACIAGQTCAAGVCACPTGQTLCGTACLDLRTDVANCGVCARACAAGQVCTAGACAMGAPANDLPAGATVISLTSPSQVLTGTTSGSTNNSGCGTAGDVYYRFTLTAREAVYVDTFGTSYDTRLGFAPSTGVGTIDTTCVDDACGGLQSQLVRVLDPGTYFVVVGGFASLTGPFTLRFQHLPIGNGSVTQITTLSPGTQTFMGTTSGTGVVTQTCSRAPGPENTYWIATCPSFTATQYNATTCGAAAFDTVLEQRSASRSANVCNDDACGLQSTIANTLPAGAGLHTFYVDGFSATTLGAYTLSLTLGACPAGQNFCGSTCTNLQTSATNCGACGTVCTAPTGGTVACTAGACVRACPTGQSNCSNVCRATQTDVANCGACGTVCTAPTGGTTSCAAGACVPACPTGQTNCTGACRNLQTENANCGACGVTCAAGNTCTAGVCRPNNNTRTSATALTLAAGETTVTGTTVAATFDGPTGCGAGDVPNVWYSFTLAAAEVVYADTAGTAYDSRLYLVNSAGALVADTCNDDAGCSTGGFTSVNQARFAAVLQPGTYYIAVSGYTAGNTGPFTLHVQHIRRALGSYFYDTAITGTATTPSTLLVGTSAFTPSCIEGASGEDVRWFVTCGSATPSLFSLCAADGATYSRRIGATSYDPVMAVYAGQSGTPVQCNDDGPDGTNCRGTGTGADTLNFGSRISATIPRGINAVVVDERGQARGMTYTLRHAIQ